MSLLTASNLSKIPRTFPSLMRMSVPSVPLAVLAV